MKEERKEGGRRKLKHSVRERPVGWGRYEPEGRRTRTEENGLNWIIHKHQGEGVFAETYQSKEK